METRVVMNMVWNGLRHRLFSNTPIIGLRRDLEEPFPTPAARVPLTVRPIDEKDAAAILSLESPDLPPEERYVRLLRIRMFKAGFKQCYLAESQGKPCYLQWLISPGENARIQSHFNRTFPILEPHEMLLEGAYTPEEWRGQGIMPCAMAQIAELARASHAKSIVTFVQADNIASLKGCARAGFKPYVTRHVCYRMFRQHIHNEMAECSNN